MSGGLGVTVLIVIAVVAVATAALAFLYFRSGMFRRSRGGRGTGKAGLMGQSRIEVLESTPVDDERRLVLLRCDRIEHLILVGGPADLVVENDVKKVRGPGVPAPAAAVPGAAQPAAAAAALFGTTAPAPSTAPSPVAHRSAPATPAPSPSRMSPPAPAPALRAPETRPRPSDAQFPRRDAASQTRRPIQPAPLGGNRPEPGRDRPAATSRANGRRGEGPALPSAGVPWAEPNSIENEIVQALRFDPVPRGGSATQAHPPLPAKSASDPSTTLGDLADRLEEALAEEVQSASKVRRGPSVSADDFAFDAPASSGASSHRAPTEQRSRLSRPEAPQAMPEASPEPERRREPGASERREEAPVISLNSRRRESSDALEDEMARLLGELTGDTKGR